MYLYVSEIFPTEIRPIGMGFSLFGQFAGKIFLSSLHLRHILKPCSNPYPPTDRAHGLRKRRLEILPGHHLLVRLLYSRYGDAYSPHLNLTWTHH